jgi:PTH1 family peptidyl-tRNA hydrolase
MLGTKNFARIRIGIAKQKEVDTIDYVLSKFSKKEMETVNESLIKFPNMIDDLLRNGITYIMNHYNGSDKQ